MVSNVNLLDYLSDFVSTCIGTKFCVYVAFGGNWPSWFSLQLQPLPALKKKTQSAIDQLVGHHYPFTSSDVFMVPVSEMHGFHLFLFGRQGGLL